MAPQIPSQKADALAHELAAATGEDIDTAVIRALEERLARIPRSLARDRQIAVEELFNKLASMPVVDSRAPDEIIGYGPDGLPN
jgi:antitoxin VapB